MATESPEAETETEAEAEAEADFVCPFCGRDYDGQDVLTDHFEEKHDFHGIS